MINQTISHYPAFRDPVQRDKILEKSRPEVADECFSTSRCDFEDLPPSGPAFQDPATQRDPKGREIPPISGISRSMGFRY